MDNKVEQVKDTLSETIERLQHIKSETELTNRQLEKLIKEVIHASHS